MIVAREKKKRSAVDSARWTRYKITMHNNTDAMTTAFENLITMWSLPVAAARCMLAFDEEDHAMVQKTAIVYDQLLSDVEEFIPAAKA